MNKSIIQQKKGEKKKYSWSDTTDNKFLNSKFQMCTIKKIEDET